MAKLIPAPLIAVVSDIVSAQETHASLDSLFMYAEAVGEPPEGSKHVKSHQHKLARQTLFRAACSAARIHSMAQGKQISSAISSDALQAIKDMGAAAKQARVAAGEGQAAASARLGVHVQTIARIESGEPGVAVGHILGLLSLYGVTVRLQIPEKPE